MAKRTKYPQTTERLNFKSAGAVRKRRNGDTAIDALTLVGMKRDGFAQEYAELERQERPSPEQRVARNLSLIDEMTGWLR